MESIAEFSERFSELIEGMNFTKVGEIIGMSKQTVSAYAHGVRNPKKPTIQAIAGCFNVNPAWLLGYDVPKYKEESAPTEEGGLDDLDKEIISFLPELTPEQKQMLLAQLKTVCGHS